MKSIFFVIALIVVFSSCGIERASKAQTEKRLVPVTVTSFHMDSTGKVIDVVKRVEWRLDSTRSSKTIFLKNNSFWDPNQPTSATRLEDRDPVLHNENRSGGNRDR